MASAKAGAKGSAAKKGKGKARNKHRPRCQGVTVKGTRCKNGAKADSKFCGSHGSDICGRPTKFTPDVREKVLVFTTQGNFKNATCKAAGITEVTLASWLERGEADEALDVESEFSEFFRAFRQAEGEGEVRLVAVLQAHAKDGSTRAAIEILKRRFRNNWGDSVTIDDQTEPRRSTLDPDKLSLEKRRELVKLMREAQRDPDPQSKGP